MIGPFRYPVGVCTAIVFLVGFQPSGAQAVENPFKSMWPFAKSNSVATSPFPKPAKTNNSLLAAPSRFFDKAEKQTDALVQKTKDNFKGMQDFGKSMSPFGKSKPQKKSFMDTLFPKKPVEPGPATVGEFLNMKRPGF